MINHSVLFRFKSGFSSESIQVRHAHAAMQNLPEKVPGILSWQYGFNVTPDADAADYALLASFDDRQALLAYFEHPAHLDVLALWNEVAELSFVDFEN